MAATTVAQGKTAEKAATLKHAPVKGPGTPWWIWICVATIVLFCLIPFYWLVNISLKTGPELSSASLWPHNPTLSNYKSIFQNSSFTRALGNSAIVALSTTFIGVIVGSFAAYALARLTMRGKFLILGIILAITTWADHFPNPERNSAAPIAASEPTY